MNQRAEPTSAWSLDIGTRDLLYLNTRQIGLAEARTGSKRGGCLDFDSGLARLRDCRGTALLPLIVGLLATSDLGAALVGLQDPLLPHADVLFDVKCQYVRIPPGHRVGAYARLVQARPDASAGWGHPLRTPVDNALLSEAWRSRNRFGLGPSRRQQGTAQD